MEEIKKEIEINKEIEKKKEKIKSWLKNKNFAFLSAILIFAFFVRIYFFQIAKNQTHWWDSLAYGNIAKNLIFHMWDESVYILGELNIRPPLLPYLWSILLRLNFSDASSIFFLELLPSVVSVWLIFLIAKEMYGRDVGYVSAFLFSVSWIHIFYSLRMLTDVPSLAFSLASLYFFIKSYENVDSRRFSFSIFFLSFAVLTRYVYAIIGVVYIVFLLINHKHKIFLNKKFYRGGLIGATPLIIFFLMNLYFHGNIMPATSVYQAGAESQPFAFYTLSLFTSILLKPWLSFFIIGLTFVVFSLFLHYGQINKSKLASMHLFNLLVLAMGLGFFIFFLRAAEDRYLFMIFLPLLVFTSLGLVYVSNFLRKYSKLLGVIFLLAILFFGAYYQLKLANEIIVSRASTFRQMKEAFLWVKENTPEDAVFLGMGVEPYAIYYSERPVEAWPQKDFENSVEQVIENSDYLVINAFHPTEEKITNYINQNLQNRLETAYVSFFDQAQTQPAVIIYKIKKEI
ncbi:glycosyltransferase family 39 protein [Candidatus Pacearchaeota archaeon]|nr:glycosyltransferase family 39 protein [Candidatus Pacearchaeota archaeon]